MIMTSIPLSNDIGGNFVRLRIGTQTFSNVISPGWVSDFAPTLVDDGLVAKTNFFYINLLSPVGSQLFLVKHDQNQRPSGAAIITGNTAHFSLPRSPFRHLPTNYRPEKWPRGNTPLSREAAGSGTAVRARHLVNPGVCWRPSAGIWAELGRR